MGQVLQLFFQYLDRTTAARLATEADDVGILSVASKVHGISANASETMPTAGGGEAQSPKTSGVGVSDALGSSGDIESAVTPWSWTTDEANQYLFSQIESDFAFGEGGLLDWSPEAVSDFAGFDQFT